MRTNTAVKPKMTTNNEGSLVRALSAEQELRRAVLTTMLWESGGFYENGEEIATRITKLAAQLPFSTVAALAIEARNEMKLRHMPLFLARLLAARPNNGRPMGDLLVEIIQRADELPEFLALYWKDNPNAPLAKQVKVGLARAMNKFDEYQLAKYNRDHAVKLRDVLFMVHSRPRDAKGAGKRLKALNKANYSRGEVRHATSLYTRLVNDTMQQPQTWEERLSAGADKKATFTTMLLDQELGALALLRNLRNMVEAGVDDELIRESIKVMKTERILPFQFITAARYAPRFERELEQAMLACLRDQPKLTGTTALIVDTSPSMWQAKVSAKSELTRFDAAAALAILCRELCENVHIWTFNTKAHEIPPRSGFALRDAMNATRGNASYGGYAVQEANNCGYDRIIVLTDGEWHTPTNTLRPALQVAPPPRTKLAYMINVANTRNGVGYGAWTSIDGWSEAIVRYIQTKEQKGLD
jgi:60 kDa SS-A/Ro ribonucleoprotein